MDEVSATFSCTVKKMREFYFAFLFRPLYIVLLAVIIPLGAVGLFVGLKLMHIQIICLSAAIFGISALIITLLIFQILRSAKISHARYMEINGGAALENQITVGNGRITLTNPVNNNMSVIALSSVKRVFATKSLLVLITAAKQAVMLDKSTVSGGWEPCLRGLKIMLAARKK